MTYTSCIALKKKPSKIELFNLLDETRLSLNNNNTAEYNTSKHTTISDLLFCRGFWTIIITSQLWLLHTMDLLWSQRNESESTFLRALLLCFHCFRFLVGFRQCWFVSYVKQTLLSSQLWTIVWNKQKFMCWLRGTWGEMRESKRFFANYLIFALYTVFELRFFVPTLAITLVESFHWGSPFEATSGIWIDICDGL